MSFIDSLFGRHAVNRDGSSVEKAIVIDDIGEEYLWVQENCMGFQPQMQSLQHINGKPYDVLGLIKDKGEERTVYFDISRFYGKSR